MQSLDTCDKICLKNPITQTPIRLDDKVYKLNVDLLCRDSTSLAINITLNFTKHFNYNNTFTNASNDDINRDNKFKENLMYVAQVHGDPEVQKYVLLVSIIITQCDLFYKIIKKINFFLIFSIYSAVK